MTVFSTNKEMTLDGAKGAAPVVEVHRPADLIRHGLIGGSVAATTLAAGEMAATVLLGGAASDPFRLVASVVFGPQTFWPEFSLWVAVAAGAAIHLGLSVLFAVVFVFLLAVAYQLSARAPLLLLYGVVYGLILWELNLVTVVQLFFPRVAAQFGLAAQIWNGVVAYTVFYGLTLGTYLALARPGVVADWKR